MLLRPVLETRRYDPEVVIAQLREDMYTVTYDALENHGGGAVEEVTAHGIVGSVSRRWKELRMSDWWEDRE